MANAATAISVASSTRFLGLGLRRLASIKASIPIPSPTDSDRMYREKDHHLAGAGYIAKLGCQIKQTHLVLNNILLNTTHGVTPLRFQRSI